MKRVFLVALTILAFDSVQATELYRWVDKDGIVHYADKPVENADKVKLGGYDAASGVDDASLPFEVRMAKKNFPVTLYVSEACAIACNQARDFLKNRHIPFSEVMLKTEEDVANFRQKSGTDNVPTISLGRQWLKGFQSQDWGKELEAAGYPK